MGTEFILGFMENRPWMQSPGTDIELFITTISNTPADVTLTTPLFDPNWEITVTVTRGKITTVKVPYTIKGSGVEKAGKGLWIRATEEVSVFAVNKETYSTDAYLAFPLDVLGTRYFAVTFTKEAELMLVGTQDNTTVSITWPSHAGPTQVTYNNVTYSNGDTLTLTLNKFETFHVIQETPQADFTGAHVLSDRPVVALSGNKKVTVDPEDTRSADHLTEMLMPVETWGKRFLTFSTPERGRGDIYRFVASEDNTTVSMSNGQQLFLEWAGDFQEVDIPSGDYRTVTSDKPVLIVLFAKTFNDDGPTRGDPSMTYIIPAEQFAADYIWSTVKTPENKDFDNKLTVIVHSQDLPGLLLDDQQPVWEEQAPIPGSDGMLHLWARISPGAHNVYHIDPAVVFMAIATGTEAFNSYAYPAGLRLALINAVCEPSAANDSADIVDNDCDGRIDEETLNGIDDDEDGEIDEDLAMPPRVDGNWGEWGQWGDCSVNCGGRGVQARTRSCDNPAPANNGRDCETGAWTNYRNCSRKNCTGSGPVCTKIGRRCLSDATCHNHTRTCSCPPGQRGDATIACVNMTHELCTVECDPKVLTWDGAKVAVNLPCWYLVSDVITNITSPPGLEYSKCSVQVLALNELTSQGLFYVRSVKVMVRFVRYENGDEPVFRSGVTEFTITQEQIRQAGGNDPWTKRAVTDNSVSIVPTWDGNDNMAVLTIAQCDVSIRFRPHVPDQLPQVEKPGVTVIIPKETKFRSSNASQSVCGLAGEGRNVYRQEANDRNLRSQAQDILFNILRDTDIRQHEENPDFGESCDALSDVMSACDADKQALAVKLCTPILNSRFTLRCLQAGGVDVVETTRLCMAWVCFSSTTHCNDYLNHMSASNCTTTGFMNRLGCDIEKLERNLRKML